MGGFAQIPTIEQTTPVQDVPPRYARTAPYVPAPQARAEAQVGEGLGKLGEILAVQYQHRQILDADTVSEGVRNKFMELRVKNAELPGDQQASTFQQQSNDIIKAAIDDPANGHIKSYLESELPKQQGLFYRDALEAGARQTMQEHKQQVTFLGKQTANTTGADYSLRPDGTFGDGPVAQAAEMKYAATVDAIYGKNPAAVSEIMAVYQQAKLEKRLQSVAEQDPTQIGAFVKSLPPGVVDGNQILGAYSHANESMAMPLKVMDANAAMARAAAVKYQQDYIAKNGHPDMERLSNDAAHSVIQPKDFEGFTGMEYQRPTPQPVLDSWTSQIKNASSQEDIDALRVNIGFAGASKQINGRDVAPLQMMAEQRARELKTPAGQAEIEALRQLKANYYPTTREDQRYETRYPGSFARAAQQAEMAYKAETFGKPTDPKAYFDAMQKVMKQFPHPGGSAPPRGAETPAYPTHAIDDATAAAYSAWLATHPRPVAPEAAR